MSSAPHDDAASSNSFSTTSSLDAMTDAEIKNAIRTDIARGWEAIAKHQELERVENEFRSSKKPSNMPPTLGGVNVFYNASRGNRVFPGTVDENSKFTHFSLVAREQLARDTAGSSKNSNASKKRSVTLGRIDHVAGLLVINYINTNNIHNPEPLTNELLPAASTFAFRYKVHQAFNAFRILRQVCGDDFRDRLCYEIRQLPIVTFADFQLVCETVPFDAGLMNVMQNKVAYHTLRGWIIEHELACIWEYVGKCDATKGRNYAERIEILFQKLQADADARGQVFKSGHCAEGATPPTQQGAGAASVMPMRPKNMTVGAAENPAVTSARASTHGGGTHIHTTEAIQPADLEPTFVRPSTAGPPLDLSSPHKATPTKLTGKAGTNSASIPKLTLKTGNPTVSNTDGKIDWLATETTPATKPFGNVGGVIGAIKAAPGLSRGKGKDKVAVSKTKEQDEDKDDGGKEDGNGDGKGKGKGKANITPTEASTAASPSTPGKMSWARLLGGS